MLGDVLEESFAGSIGEVLNVGAGWICGADEYEDSFALLRGDIDEGLDPVETAVGGHCDGVGPGQVVHTDEAGIGQKPLGVGLGRAAYVATFGVGDYLQAQGLGFLDERVVGVEAVPKVALEKG